MVGVFVGLVRCLMMVGVLFLCRISMSCIFVLCSRLVIVLVFVVMCDWLNVGLDMLGMCMRVLRLCWIFGILWEMVWCSVSSWLLVRWFVVGGCVLVMWVILVRCSVFVVVEY